MVKLKPIFKMTLKFFGKFDWLSTAITCGAAPIANNISVKDGESEIILLGLFSARAVLALIPR